MGGRQRLVRDFSIRLDLFITVWLWVFMPIASTELFSAFADPTRRAIFEPLARDGEQTAGVLTGQAGVSQPAGSQHLADLKLAPLALDPRDGRQTHHRAHSQGLAPLLGWLQPTEPS